MSEFLLNKAKTVCVSGHRALPNNFNKEKLKNAFLTLIDNGYDTFLVGMALGFDTICFNLLEQIRQKKSIKIVACVPCEEQDKLFNAEQKKEYRRMLEEADQKFVLSKIYTPQCMQKRNKFMVDNSSIVIAYLSQNFGGTKNTVEYAIKRGVVVVNMATI